MKIKTICIACAFVLTAGFFLATQSPAAEPYHLGVDLAITGTGALYCKDGIDAIKMAVDEINAAGGVNGKKIELIIEDTTGKPDVGRSAIEKLISRDKVVMLGGGYSSSVTWATVAVAQQRKVPFLVNTGSADRIT